MWRWIWRVAWGSLLAQLALYIGVVKVRVEADVQVSSAKVVEQGVFESTGTGIFATKYTELE